MADTPHWSLPFRFERLRTGEARIPVTEQDSIAEIRDCVELILRTEVGERGTLPGFGRPQSLAFTTDREVARIEVQTAIDDSEPRVRALVEAGELDLADPGVLRLLAMYEMGGAE
jgi:phage baseplate assembly protein W